MTSQYNTPRNHVSRSNITQFVLLHAVSGDRIILVRTAPFCPHNPPGIPPAIPASLNGATMFLRIMKQLVVLLLSISPLIGAPPSQWSGSALSAAPGVSAAAVPAAPLSAPNA